MKKSVRKAASLLLSLRSAICLSFTALAADASVTYDGNAREFIFAPGSDYSPTDLFDNFKGVMPGDSLTQQIEVRNDVSNNVKIKLYLRSLGAQDGSEEFLSQMNLTVAQDGDSQLFDAPADETDGLTDWVYLGTFYSGAEIDLDVVLNVPETMDNAFQDAVGELSWQFKVEELPVEPDDPTPPDTGSDSELLPYGIAIGCCFVLLTALPIVAKKRRQQR